MINLLLLGNFYPVMPCRRVRKESDELLNTGLVTRYGPSAQVVKVEITRKKRKRQLILQRRD